MTNRRILVTGLAGKIGSIVEKELSMDYKISGLDLRPAEGRTIRIANLSDYESILPAFDGIDTVIHLAADPNHQGDWKSNLENNIIGTRNVYEASRVSNVRRLIFASSNHVVGFHPLSDNPYKQIYRGDFAKVKQPIKHLSTSMIRPDGYYGVSKSFGESMGSYFHDEYGLSVICIRIGWVMEPDDPTFSPSALALWMSHKDTADIFRKSVEAPESVGFAIVYGMSNNTYGIWDLEPGRNILEFCPEDNAGTEWKENKKFPTFMTSGDPQELR